MIATSVYHLFYAVFTARGRGQLVADAPLLEGREDVVGTIRYYLGLADGKPKFDRFSYVEKAEYLALVWGTIVMVVTGLLLWFQGEALKHIPMWGLDVATARPLLRGDPGHPGHLRLASLLRVRQPGFRSHVLRLDRRKLSRHDMEHEHALELEEIEAYARRGRNPPRRHTDRHGGGIKRMMHPFLVAALALARCS